MSVYVLMPVITAFLAMMADLASFRIPNRLLAACLISGIGIRVFRLPAGRASWAVCTFPEIIAGFFIPVVILILPFLVRGLGAGDVKLFCVLGSMLGSRGILACMLYSFAAGGAEALVILAVRKNRKERMHFTVPVFAGTCLFCFLSCRG